MAFILRLTDGTDTIDFIDEAFQVEDGGLQISPPEQIQTWTDPSSVGFGQRLVENRVGNRTVNITFHISGVDRPAMREGVNRINALLTKAIKHSLGTGPDRVTLQYAWDGVTTVDNFEVLSGKLIMPDDVLSVEKLHTTWGALYRLRGCQLEMTVGPQSYGLSPSTGELIELPLTNRNGTDLTGGIVVRPFTDTRSIQVGGYYIDNYVEIDGADILGDSPAILKIEMQSNTTSPRHSQFIIGAHRKHAGQMVFHWEDPNVEIFLAGSSRAVDYTLGGSIWRSGNLWTTWRGRVWRVRLQNPEVYGSKKYRVFMSTGFWPYQYTSRVPMQVQVETSSGTVLAQGPVVEQYFSSASAMIQDLGVVQIPPYSPKLPDPQDVYLSLNIVGDAPFEHALTMAYIWLVPVEQGYRQLKLQTMLGNYIATTPKVIDDYWEGLSYIADSVGGSTIPAVQAMFAPITLEPGYTSRIYFNFSGHNYIPYNADNWIIRIFYSPVYAGAV